MRQEGLLLFLLPALAGAVQLHVGSSGIDDVTCGADLSPCSTLNYTIGRASSGDEIVLLAGTLSGPGNRNIEWPNNLTDVAIRAASASPADTVVDLEYQGFMFDFYDDPPVVLEGFTIRRGAGKEPETGREPGGVLRIELSSPSFIRMHFRDCFLQGTNFASRGSVGCATTLRSTS